MHTPAARIARLLVTLVGLTPAWGGMIVGQLMPYPRSFDTNQIARYKAQFEIGDTNAPLLAMDWFSHGDYFCRVTQPGAVSAALDVGYAIEGGHRTKLDAANRFLLVQMINRLPPSSRQTLPRERQIFVCGIRSNQWFQCVYDRANVPPEAERLFAITGAYLEWFIPKVGPDSGNYRASQSMINSFTVADDAPVAVSTGVNGLQVWDVNQSSGSATLPLKKTPYRADLWSVATLSPDGKIIVFTGEQKNIYAYDRWIKDVIWEIPDADVGNAYNAGNRVFAVGNQGRSLFITEANRIEHWDMATGIKIATLITNQSGVKFLQASRNGSVLVAGFGDHSFMVWQTDQDKPVFGFTEPAGAISMAISPDGRKIVLCTENPRGQLILWDVQTKVREKLPLRTPYASSSASSLYWSPDGKWLAADVDTYPSSIVIYETATWKPVAQWPCGQIMTSSRFGFRNDGVFLELIDHALLSLDFTKSAVTSSNPVQKPNVSQPPVAEQKEPVPDDKDLRDFEERVKQTVDPFQLQRLAIPIIAHLKPGDMLREYDSENADFFRLAREVYGYQNADVYESKIAEHTYVPAALLITCSPGDYHHRLGLAVGNKDFAGPRWTKHHQVFPWKNGIYFWEDTRDRP
jgi:hypothetical protein